MRNVFLLCCIIYLLLEQVRLPYCSLHQSVWYGCFDTACPLDFSACLSLASGSGRAPWLYCFTFSFCPFFLTSLLYFFLLKWQMTFCCPLPLKHIHILYIQLTDNYITIWHSRAILNAWSLSLIKYSSPVDYPCRGHKNKTNTFVLVQDSLFALVL